eukprot:7358917-Prymnesium_polylepis.1
MLAGQIYHMVISICEIYDLDQSPVLRLGPKRIRNWACCDVSTVFASDSSLSHPKSQQNLVSKISAKSKLLNLGIFQEGYYSKAAENKRYVYSPLAVYVRFTAAWQGASGILWPMADGGARGRCRALRGSA